VRHTETVEEAEERRSKEREERRLGMFTAE